MLYDVFISYRHKRKAEVLAFCELLDQANVSFYRDEDRRGDDDSIQRGIEQGLASSRLLLAWYDPSYLASKACAWELSRSIMAAHAGGGWPRRIVCVDPTGEFRHIVPAVLADQAHLTPFDKPDALVRMLRERSEEFAEPLGTIASGHVVGWYERAAPWHPGWVGRGRELISLFDQLHIGSLEMHAGERAPVAVTGWGGDGKTMLAEQFALRFGSAYPGGVVWLSGAAIDGSSGGSDGWHRQLEAALDHVAEGELGIVTRHLVSGQSDPASRIRAVKRAIEERLTDRASRHPCGERAPPYLWIVDDLPEGIDGAEQALWQPRNTRAHCIVTVRDPGSVDGRFHLLPLLSLGPEDALRILARRRAPLDVNERACAERFIDEVGGLPLALELGATLVDSLGYRSVVELLQVPLSVGLEPLVEELRGALPTGHARSIVKTFERSLRLVPGDQDDSASPQQRADWTVLRLAALLSPHPLPHDFALRVLRTFGVPLPAIALSRAVITLQGAALLRRDGASGPETSLMQPLLARTVLDTRLSAHQCLGMLSQSLVAAQDWLAEECDRPVARVDRRLIAVTYALLVAFTLAVERGVNGAAPVIPRPVIEKAARLADAVGALARRVGRLSDARRLFESGVHVRNKLLGASDMDMLHTLSDLAVTLQEQGELSQARRLHEKLLALRRATLNDTHPDTLDSMHNLASTLLAQGQLTPARELQVQVLAARISAHGEADPETWRAAEALALTTLYEGDLAEARRLQEMVLAARRAACDEPTLDTLLSMRNLSLTLQQLGDPSSALALQEEELAGLQGLVDNEHPHLLSAKMNLALTWLAMGVLDRASKTLQEVLDVQSRVLGREDVFTLSTMHNLAAVLLDLHDAPRARDLNLHVYEVRRRLLGAEDANTLASANNLAVSLREMGDLAGARALQLELNETLLRLYGPDDPNTMGGLHNLAITAEYQREADALAVQRGSSG